MTHEIEQEIPLKYSLPTTFFIFAISVLGTWLSLMVTQVVFKLTIETSFLAFFRTLMIFTLFIVVFPLSVAVEILYVKWKKRRLRPRNIFLGSAVIGEAVVALIVISLIFESLFPGLSFTHEPFLGASGLVLGLTVSFPIIIVGLTSRIPRLRQYVRKAFE